MYTDIHIYLLSARRPWYSRFRLALNDCRSIDDIEILLCRQVSRWRGKAGRLILGAPGRGYEWDEKTREDANLEEDLGMY